MPIVPQELIERLRRGRVLLFVGQRLGQGASGQPEVEPWAGELLAMTGVAGEGAGSFREAAQAYEDANGREALRQYLSNQVANDGGRTGGVHRVLSQLPMLDLVVSLAIDSQLERALEESGRQIEVVVGSREPKADPGTDLLLFRLHGSLTAGEPIVITEEDYDAFLVHPDPLPAYLRGELTQRTIVFMGHLLDDPRFRQMYLKATAGLDSPQRRDYAVTGEISPSTARWCRRHHLVAIESDDLTFSTELLGQLRSLHETLPEDEAEPEVDAVDAIPELPYKLLDYYEARDVDIFFGRSAETLRLSSLIHAHRLVILYGASGTGKTSLLLAGVGPLLERSSMAYEQVYVRALRDPAGTIRSAVRRLILARQRDTASALPVEQRPAVNLSQLREMIIDAFDEGELRDLCFDLGISYGSLSGESTHDRIRELVSYCKRRGKIAILVETCRRLRPLLPWPEPRSAADFGQVGSLTDETPLVDFLDAAARFLGGTLVIVLDQFEEFFIRLSTQIRESFVEDLGAIYDSRDVPVKVVLSLREDWLAAVGEIEARIPEIYRLKMRLLPLTREQARQAIVSPVVQLGVQYEPDLVDRLLADLVGSEGSSVLPPQLQLVCSVLYAKREPEEKLITMKMYHQLGGARGVLQEYLEDELARLKSDERSLARALLEELVTSQGTKSVKGHGELALALEITEVRLMALTSKLVNARLLRVLEQGDDDEQAYELAHEYLVQELGMDGQVQRRKQTEELIGQEVENWQRFGTLLGPDKFALINDLRESLRLSPGALELLLYSAMKLGQEISYWLARIEDPQTLLTALIGGLESDQWELREAATEALVEVSVAKPELATECAGLLFSALSKVEKEDGVAYYDDWESQPIFAAIMTISSVNRLTADSVVGIMTTQTMEGTDQERVLGASRFRRAFGANAMLATADALAALQTALEERTLDVRLEAVRAIGELALANPELPDRALVSTLLNEASTDNWQLASEAVNTLGKIGQANPTLVNRHLIRELMGLLQSEDQVVRLQVVSVLGKLLVANPTVSVQDWANLLISRFEQAPESEAVETALTLCRWLISAPSLATHETVSLLYDQVTLAAESARQSAACLAQIVTLNGPQLIEETADLDSFTELFLRTEDTESKDSLAYYMGLMTVAYSNWTAGAKASFERWAIQLLANQLGSSYAYESYETEDAFKLAAAAAPEAVDSSVIQTLLAILQSSDYEASEQAARAISAAVTVNPGLATSSVAEALLARLDDEDLYGPETALSALARANNAAISESVVQVLLDLLQGQDDGARTPAASSLEYVIAAEVEVAARLSAEPLARWSYDLYEAESAFQELLFRFPDAVTPALMTSLTQHLSDEDSEVRVQAAYALKMIVEARPELASAELAEATFKALVVADEYEIREALEAILIADPEALPDDLALTVMDWLQSADERVQRIAATIVGGLAAAVPELATKAVAEVLKALADRTGDSVFKLSLSNILSVNPGLATPGLVEMLWQWIEDDDPELSSGATRALAKKATQDGQLAGATLMEKLVQRVSEGDWAVQQPTIAVIGELVSKRPELLTQEVVDTLASEFGQEDEELRDATFEAARRIWTDANSANFPEFSAAVERWLSDPDWSVRESATVSLGQLCVDYPELASWSLVKALANRVADANATVSAAAQEALSDIVGASPSWANGDLPAHLQNLYRTQSARYPAGLEAILAQIYAIRVSDQHDLELLFKMLTDPVRVRERPIAARALFLSTLDNETTLKHVRDRLTGMAQSDDEVARVWAHITLSMLEQSAAVQSSKADAGRPATAYWAQVKLIDDPELFGAYRHFAAQAALPLLAPDFVD